MSLTPEQSAVVAGVIVAVVTAGLKGLWVFGWVHKAIVSSLTKQLTDMTRDRDYWRNIALRSMGHTDRALEKIPDAEKPASDG